MIYRYEVPVDDQEHEITTGPPLFVASRRPDVVEFWADPHVLSYNRRYFVVGTGHPIPPGAVYVGTALIGPFAWHLMSF